MMPEVSVVLPYYNAEDTLEESIKSILDQTFTDFELLLVDNRSTDRSSAIAREFAGRDKRICLLKENEKGVSFAMNRGMENAGGKFIARMDADDLAMRCRLEKQVAYLDQNSGIDLVGSEVTYVPCNERSDGFRRFVKWNNSFHSPQEIELNRFIEIPVINPTILFKRELFDKFGGCREGEFPEDYEMLLRYLDCGARMIKLKEPLLKWIDSDSRLTRTDQRYSGESFMRAKAMYFYRWSERYNPFHPVIHVWGAGRKTRQRAEYLEREGLTIQGYFDIKNYNTAKRPTLHFSEIPEPGRIFIVPMVAKYGARRIIKSYLRERGYEEGKHFICLA